jgi:NitT/TauT family transport system permease protein
MDSPTESRLDEELAGLDALEVSPLPHRGRPSRAWSAVWPKLAAVAIVIFAWQLVAWAHLRPAYVLPGPGPVLRRLSHDLAGGLPGALAITLRRAFAGYAIALALGTAIGLAVARSRIVRAAVGSLITGLQTMPSIAWFPLAVLLFKLSETAILFVVVVGATPAIANGLIAGVDHIPPILLRAGRVLGARGLTAYRRIILPAALPGFVSGLKQGWAFAWRSLMAAELLVVLVDRVSIGVRLQFAREQSDAEGLLAVMIVILVIGIVVDAVIFGALERTVRRRWGLYDAAS